jgi:hypothetical protein
MTLLVALKPFVEQVVRAGCLSDGRIGTHMIMRGLSQDSEI